MHGGGGNPCRLDIHPRHNRAYSHRADTTYLKQHAAARPAECLFLYDRIPHSDPTTPHTGNISVFPAGGNPLEPAAGFDRQPIRTAAFRLR